MMNGLGCGIYGYADAGRLVGTHRSTVYGWFEHHRFRTSTSPHVSTDGVISFLDLIEAKVVGKLRQMGVAMRMIRQAHGIISNELETEHPFSIRHIYSDGQAIFLQAVEQISIGKLVDVVRRQHFFPAILPFLRRVDYDDQTLFAARWHISEGVVLDPMRRFGKPIVEHCGLSTSVLAAAFRANDRDSDRVADWYGIQPIDVECAVGFERRIRRCAA